MIITLRATLLGLLLAAAPVAAQQPTLRVGTDVVQGTRAADGAALFPSRALELLGYRITATESAFTAVLDSDTLHFELGSPFFRAGSRTLQLVRRVDRVNGVWHLPEQLFIRTLPTTLPARFAYRDGGVQRVDAVVTTPPARSPAAAARRTTRVVVLDPGHGGRDPGKIGPNGIREKDVTLLIAQRVAVALRARGYEVHMTRTTDTLIALSDRPRLANEWRGDRPVALFLSIHANAATAASARGFETFFLSEARTEDERRVAAMENEAVRFEETPAAPAAAGLDQILSGLRSDFLTRASHDLASVMQERMATFHPGPNRGVKRGGLVVLIGSIMPAVLIEVGFLSNRTEAELIATPAFQNRLATAISDGVDEFFRRNEHLWQP